MDILDTRMIVSMISYRELWTSHGTFDHTVTGCWVGVLGCCVEGTRVYIDNICDPESVWIISLTKDISILCAGKLLD